MEDVITLVLLEPFLQPWCSSYVGISTSPPTVHAGDNIKPGISGHSQSFVKAVQFWYHSLVKLMTLELLGRM